MKWFRKRNNKIEIGNWYVGWKSRGFEITYRSRGKHCENAEINISMFGWYSLFRLPYIHKQKDNNLEEKKYGLSVFENTLFIYYGHKCKSCDLPFVSYGSVMIWERYIGSKEQYFYDSKQKENWETHPHKMKYEGGCQDPTTWSYDYTDPYDGEIIPCKFWVEKLEWRPKWLKWTAIFAKKYRYIEIEFSREVGEGKGSGGTIGYRCQMLPGEHPLKCISRLEQEDK